MKKLFKLVILLAIAGGIIWWLIKPSDEPPFPPTKTALAPKLEAGNSVLAPRANEVALPAVQPVSAHSTPQADADLEPVDRSDLNASISDMLKLIEANDASGYRERYTAPSFVKTMQEHSMIFQKEVEQYRAQQGIPPLPEETFEEARQKLMNMPLNFADSVLLNYLYIIKDQTPKLNADGTQAVFTIDPATAASNSIPANRLKVYFHKENGEWYPGG